MHARFGMSTEVRLLLRAWVLSCLAILAVIGQSMLLMSAWLLPALASTHPFAGSARTLFLGQRGLLQNAAFIASGLTTIALSCVIRTLTAGSAFALMGSILIGAYGVGAVLTGFFPAEQVRTTQGVWVASPTGSLHVYLALASFISAVTGMLLITWRFQSARHWRGLTRYSALAALGALALLCLQGQGPWMGLMQRLLVTMIASWLIVVAFHVPGVLEAERRSRETLN
jgi:hypothetical protein